MSRVIKFKFWNENSKSMITELNGFAYNGINKLFEDFVRSKQFIPLQFIGLCDKNGEEVYEGDILKEIDERGILEDKIYEVAWDDKETGFAGFTYGYYRNASLFKFMEVIGNIYENSDLLKDGGK